MSREEIKEKFLKSYNCSSMKEFKHTKLTSDKFYEIMEDYFTKCSYNQKYKEVIDRLKKYIRNNTLGFDGTTGDIMINEKCLFDILKEVK